MAVDSSLVVRITVSRQDGVGLSPVIQATSLVDPLDQVQVDSIDVLPQPVSLKTNRDLLMAHIAPDFRRSTTSRSWCSSGWSTVSATTSASQCR